jgi:hypothetical protein
MKGSSKPRDLRRTSLWLDETDRRYLSDLVGFLGLRATEVLRLALRTLAYQYGITKERPAKKQ